VGAAVGELRLVGDRQDLGTLRRREAVGGNALRALQAMLAAPRTPPRAPGVFSTSPVS
jgi:hypothetical protein